MTWMSSPFARWGAGALVFVAVLAALRLHPWQQSAASTTGEPGSRETLAVGFLPVTCHLTCPVTDFASKTSQSRGTGS